MAKVSISPTGMVVGIAVSQRKTTPSELMAFATIDRVAGRMEPFIKAMQ